MSINQKGSRKKSLLEIFTDFNQKVIKLMCTKKTSIKLFLSACFLFACNNIGYAETLWSKLKSGDHFVLIRHALAPGYSDPSNFDVEDCKTQRNLSDEGRQQAENIGRLFRANEIDTAILHSSQWCRCLETSRLLNLGKVAELPALNSFFENPDRERTQTEALLKWLRSAPLKKPTVLVSHQVNIAALTDVSPDSGEIIFVNRLVDGSLSVIGSIQTLE